MGAIFVLVAAVYATLIWSARDGSTGVANSRAWLRVRSALPPLLLLLCLPSGCQSGRFDSLRLNVTALVAELDARTPTPRAPLIVVGGDRNTDDVVVTEGNGAIVPGPYLRIEAPSAQPALAHPSTRASDGGAIVTAYDTEKGRRYVGAFALEPGDRLCLNRCDRPDGRWYVFEAEGRFDPQGGKGRAFDRGAGAKRPVQRLSEYFCDRSESGECRSPALADPASPDGGRYPALSFVFEESGGWSVVLLDPGARLMRQGRTVAAGARAFGLDQGLPLSAKTDWRFAILALRERSLQERRSFVVREDALARDKREIQTIRLEFDTPEQVPIGDCADPLSRLATAPTPADPGSIVLDSIGRRPSSFLTSAADSFSILPKAMCRGVSHIVRASAEAAPGSPNRGIEFRVDRMNAPVLLALIAIASAFLFHLAGSSAWAADPLDSVVFALAQFLVVARAIIGIEAVFADPALDWRLIYADAGVALVAVPAVLLALRPRAQLDLVTLGSVSGFAAAVFIALRWWLGSLEFSIALIIAGTLGLLFLRILHLALAPAMTAAEALRSWFKPPSTWPLLLAAIIGLRLLLALAGVKERVGGLPISALYVPALMIGLGGLLAQAEANQGRSSRTAAVFLAALLLGFAGVGFLIKDIGFALAHLPPIAGVALWRFRLWRRQPPEAGGRVALAYAFPAAGLALGYVMIWMLVAFTSPPPDRAPLEDRVAYSTERPNMDPNVLRLRAVFAPAQIGRIANKAAAEQLDQSALIAGMTDRLLGHGYMAPLRLGSFRTNAAHISDYVAAAHIMAPFGRFAAVALLAIVGLAAAAACSGGRAAVPAGPGILAGALAIWTVFGLATYMTLSNLLLVPFTGRNIYLLSPGSGGDMVEGLALLAIARIGLARRWTD
jgi:hypothetical protein